MLTTLVHIVYLITLLQASGAECANPDILPTRGRRGTMGRSGHHKRFHQEEELVH